MADQNHVELLKQGRKKWNSWRKDHELSKIELSNADLRGMDLSGYNLQSANLNRANLSGCKMRGVDLSFADLHWAKLNENENGERVNLSWATLVDSRFYAAELRKAKLHNANLTNSTLEKADIESADLKGAILDKVNTSRIRNYKNCEYLGVRASDCYGNMGFRRYAMDQSYIEELHENKRTTIKNKEGEDKKFDFWLFLWKSTSDYGRSWKRWTILSTAIALIFGLIYMVLGYPDGKDIFVLTRPEIYNPFVSPLYYSVVTFTTLGFGDIVPRYWYIQLLVTAEVILGYIMLGGLISIFASKMTRRS